MTTPDVVNYPPLTIEAPLASPLAGGLYVAATLTPLDDPAHIDGGVEVEQRNCGEATLWTLGCDPDANPDDKGTVRDDPRLMGFPSTGVLATSRCSLVGMTEERAREDATQTLRLQEQVQVETFAAGLLLDEAGTAASAAGGLVGAVGRIEQVLGLLGMQGVIHAPASLAAEAVALRLAVPSGAQLLSPLGHRWSFGVGYSGGLVNQIVGTGPVTVYRTPTATSVAVAPLGNERLVVVEREVAVTWQCGAWATVVDADGPQPTPPAPEPDPENP